MKTITLWLDQCMPGMKIAETLSNEFNAVIIIKGAVLTQRLIDKLKNMGFAKIRVYDDSDKEIEQNKQETVIKDYEKNMDSMREVLHDIVEGKPVRMNQIEEISASLYTRKNDVLNIIVCLNQVREIDEYTYSHCLNVSFICMLVAKWLKYSEITIKEVLEGGLVHDVGKCKVPLEILNKPGKLDEEEFAEIKRHPLYGYEILKNVPGVTSCMLMAALNHHEKLNGEGYPYHLTEDKIHFCGKICAVADVYDAMTTNRVYHKRTNPFTVFRYLEEQAFRALDPKIVLVFIQNMAGYYVGDHAELSNGAKGEIVYINPRAISRPIIKAGNEIIDLSNEENRTLTITEIN